MRVGKHIEWLALTAFAGEAVLLGVFRESLALSFGEAALGAVLASLQVKYLSRTGLALVRCGREQTGAVRATLSLSSVVKGRKALFSVVHQSGTLRSSVRVAKSRIADALSGSRQAGATEAVKECSTALDLLEP